MITIPEGLRNHINSEIVTLAFCWKIILKNGKIIGFTNHDSDIIYEDVEYITGLQIGGDDLPSHNEVFNESFYLQSAMHGFDFSISDITSNILDEAKIEVFLLNYNDLSMGCALIKSAIVNKVRLVDQKLYIEMISQKAKFSKSIGNYFSRTCRADFADQYCRVDRNKFKIFARIDYVGNHNTVSINSIKEYADGYFKGGNVFDGKNYFEIEDSFNGNLIFKNKHILRQNQKIEIFQGCDKKFETCCNVFGNAVNFRGEPHMPKEKYHL